MMKQLKITLKMKGKYNAEELAKKRYYASLRRAARTKRHRQNQRDRGEECPKCFGLMSWCSCCEVWSRTCCEEYGTCACS